MGSGLLSIGMLVGDDLTVADVKHYRFVAVRPLNSQVSAGCLPQAEGLPGGILRNVVVTARHLANLHDISRLQNNACTQRLCVRGDTNQPDTKIVVVLAIVPPQGASVM